MFYETESVIFPQLTYWERKAIEEFYGRKLNSTHCETFYNALYKVLSD
jgi:hypothetical protein